MESMSNFKHTKIVATIGPATESEEILEQLAIAGMNVARFNTKHSTPDWHDSRLTRVRNVSKKTKKAIGTLLDLQGPEVRIDLPKEEEFEIKEGGKAIFTSDKNFKAKHYVIVPQIVIEALNKTDQIVLEDGACEFTVVEKSATHLEARAELTCTIKHRKTMNTPGVIMDMPSLTKRDYEYLDNVNPKNVDFVGLSFVRNAQDIKILKSELDKRSFSARIVAKIENQAAIDNLDEIIEISDVVMVARGDLGVEVPYEQLIHWQKTIIKKCIDAAKPVITATQMLKSMVDNPRPTRAEVSDVANAIFDGTDAVMLSEETTIGEYPVKAVATQATIALYNESLATHESDLPVPGESNSESAISYAAHGLFSRSKFKISKVICLTETGRTAMLLSRFRELAPTIAITSSEKTKNILSVVFGVEPHVFDLKEGKYNNVDDILDMCLKREIIKKGEVVLVCHGNLWGDPGMTNSLRVVTIK
jgi:pyruvate kinase